MSEFTEPYDPTKHEYVSDCARCNKAVYSNDVTWEWDDRQEDGDIVFHWSCVNDEPPPVPQGPDAGEAAPKDDLTTP